MRLNRCKLQRKTQNRLLEYFVLEVTARSAANLLDIQANTSALFYNKIRKIILNEFYKRAQGISENPKIHMYNFPELKEIKNEIIFENVKYLINENLVRGGIDEDQNQSFPWISRLTETGIKLIEDAKK